MSSRFAPFTSIKDLLKNACGTLAPVDGNPLGRIFWGRGESFKRGNLKKIAT